jgi:N-acyl-D-amino-acid deacylase
MAAHRKPGETRATLGTAFVGPVAAASAALLILGCGTAEPPVTAPTTLIRGAVVIDGSGAPGRSAAVRLAGDRIAEVGDLAPKSGETVIDGSGLVLAPGFIDTHSHADDAIFDHPDAVAAVSQGITTVVVGQDGASQFPLADFFSRLEAAGAAVNVASYAGHGTLRDKVLGDDFARAATDEEVERMRQLLAREMDAGALGLATGLEYDPGIYSTTDEVVALAREAAAHGGRYISHVRSEDRRFWEAIEEIVEIGRRAGLPVQISHIKLALRSLHGQTERLLARLDAARTEGVDVTADIYPYTYWQSTLGVMFPDRDYEDPAAARYAVTELAAPEDMVIPVFAPEPGLAGKTLAEIAAQRGTDAATTLIDLIRQAEALRAEGVDGEVESVIAVSMTEDDVARLMAWPQINICTDGELAGAHPRGFGAFTRVLGHYVRELRALSLEAAVEHMTTAAAAHVGLTGRGRIEPGAAADLVLFDPETVGDRATLADPHALSSGIERVWVNGAVVFENGLPSGARPGHVLRRSIP